MFADDNRPRFKQAPGGHEESWFLRANHPDRPLAVWLKATVLKRTDGTSVADAWCCTFDGEAGTTWGGRSQVPLGDALFDGPQIHIDGCHLTLSADGGAATGAIANEAGACRWDLRWTPAPGTLGEPLCMLPTRGMVEGRFPKKKLLTPSPVLGFEGTMDWAGRTVEVQGWTGMQGHNWGKEHPPQYAWGQVVFADAQGTPHCMVEGYSGQVRVAGPVVTPIVSGLVVRRRDRTFRFMRAVDLWRQDASIGDLAWTVSMRSREAEASLSLVADPKRTICLGYYDPNGALAYCLNSKTARAVLRVNPVNGEGFECRSEHGGALEILTRTPDPRFPHPV